MAKLRVEDTTASMIEKIAEYLPTHYGIFTEAGMVFIGPDDPRYAEAKQSFEDRIRRKFNGKANR